MGPYFYLTSALTCATLPARKSPRSRGPSWPKRTTCHQWWEKPTSTEGRFLVFSKLLSLATLVFLLGQMLSGAEQPRVSGIYVAQPSAPVQITSLKQTSEDLLAAVTVTNKSEKTVTGFRLGWAVGIPQSCSTSLPAAEVTRQMAVPDRVVLSPNESLTTKDYRLSTEDMVANGKQRNAALVDFQVAVMEVTFSDGSTWSAAFPGEGMFDAAAFAFQANKCRDGKLIPQALRSACNPSSPSLATTEAGPSGSQGATLSSSLGDSFPAPKILDCHFACDTSQANVVCTNSDTSCTISSCSDPNKCAKQTCTIVAC